MILTQKKIFFEIKFRQKKDRPTHKKVAPTQIQFLFFIFLTKISQFICVLFSFHNSFVFFISFFFLVLETIFFFFFLFKIVIHHKNRPRVGKRKKIKKNYENAFMSLFQSKHTHTYALAYTKRRCRKC